MNSSNNGDLGGRVGQIETESQGQSQTQSQDKLKVKSNSSVLFKAHNDSKPVSLQNLKMCKNNKHNKITKLRLFLVSMFLTQHSCDLSIIVKL